MKHLRPYALYESLVDKKIQLLKDLALELQDVGLQVDIINGSKSYFYLLRDPRVPYTDDYKKFIILKVTDDNEIFDTDLYNTDLIDDFKETLKSYGMNPRGMSGGRNFCVFKFDKHGSMTNSPIIYERVSKETKIFESNDRVLLKIKYSEEVISKCDDIISDIKDMLLELSDVGLFTQVGYTPMTLVYRDDSPKIVVEVQGNSLLCDHNEDDINSTFERIKDYTKSKGYVTGFGSWDRDNIKVYQMLIQ